MNEITQRLFDAKDEAYRAFMCPLIPNIDPETVIGVRTPILRKLAKNLFGTKEADVFLHALPHTYFEENQLHAFLIAQIKDFDACMVAVCTFLPYIDNWATCDQLSPTVFGKHPEALLRQIKIWLSSPHEYTVRFGIEMLMRWFLDENFSTAYADMVTDARADAYYIHMMVAWYFATALAKQYDAILPYIEQRKLNRLTHNKAIQKAVESHRISDEQKAYLKSLRIK